MSDASSTCRRFTNRTFENTRALPSLPNPLAGRYLAQLGIGSLRTACPSVALFGKYNFGGSSGDGIDPRSESQPQMAHPRISDLDPEQLAAASLFPDSGVVGLDTLAEAAAEVKENERADFEELQNVAEASYCHLRSTFLQIRFVRARNHGFDKPVMAECAREELKLAMDLYQIVRRDSRIGFEASNHYYYSLNDLREKVISCNRILEELA